MAASVTTNKKSRRKEIETAKHSGLFLRETMGQRYPGFPEVSLT
jgi:hypothetical protein